MLGPLEFTLSVCETLCKNVEAPDGDIPNMLVIETKKGVKMIPADHESDAAKAMLFKVVLPRLIQKLNAKTVLHIAAVWMSMYPEGEADRIGPTGTLRNDTPMPRNDPKRFEGVVVSEVSAVSYRLFVAKLARFKDLPPMIEPLVEMPGSTTYLLRDAQEALRGVRH